MEFIIDQDFHEVRLDKFLKKIYQHIPPSGIFKMIRKGNVKVNKKKKKQNYRLQSGDTVRVWEASSPTDLKKIALTFSEKTSIARAIVYEDQNILLYNKPAGLVMHSGSNHRYGLAEMLISYTCNPHLHFVHRIDKMTSGLVMAAKNLTTARQLSKLIRSRSLQKVYVVVVEGIVKEDVFQYECYLKTEEDRVRVHDDASGGAQISTSRFSVLKRGQNRSLLRAELVTGRKHQLRVQLAEMAHPIIGDAKYGRKGQNKKEGMLLFSQRLVVEELGIDFELVLPEVFYRELESGV